MDDTVLPTEWMFRVKAATRDLTRRAGGLVRAGEICGRGKSTVERWGSTDCTDIIPIPAALLLQAETGAPLITAAMAEIGGRQLAPADDAPAPGGFMAAHVRLAKETADYQHAVTAAAEDGVITANEQRDIDREATELVAAATDMRSEIAAAGGATIALFGPRRARAGS